MKYIVEALVRFTDVPTLGTIPVLHYSGEDLAQAVSALTVAATSYEGENRELLGVKMTVQPGAPSRDEAVATAAPRTAFLLGEPGTGKTALVEDEHGTKYVGPLRAAQALAYKDYYAYASKKEGKHVVVLMSGMPPRGDKDTDWDTLCFEAADYWGRGDTEEEAWRYVLGALFGPIDDQYDENALRRALFPHIH